MKWRYFFIIIMFIFLFTLIMLMLGEYNKNSLDYDNVEINTINDVKIFLKECNQKFGLDCEKLLLDKINKENQK